MGVKGSYIGQRNRRIEIVQYSAVKNAIGENQETAENSIGFFWAARVDASGAEGEDGKILHINQRVYNTVFNSTILEFGERMTVKDAGKEYNIFHVSEVGRGEQLKIKALIRE
tara:strand:+ start:8984 stop:9322 length:339 start_codon:yes stop_codon:yes gene_type:complete